jgi:hypothetical protein
MANGRFDTMNVHGGTWGCSGLHAPRGGSVQADATALKRFEKSPSQE